jgi:hypothetical protein
MELDEQLRGIQANVDMVIEQLGPGSGIDFGLNRESVAWVDGFVERQRARLSPDEIGALPSVVGCFLGACLVEATDARWAHNDELGWGLAFPSENWAFPLAKAQKQFEEGEADSILSFYDTTLAMAAAGRL